jgi:rhodanese-related sulfurtransferase
MKERNAYFVMAIGGIAVLALVAWALARSFQAPIASAVPVTTTTVAPAPVQPQTEVQDPERAAVPRISVDDLRQKLAQGEVTLIDVRDADAFMAGHIPGAIHIPLARIEGEIPYLPRTKAIVTYCTWPAEESSAGAALILEHGGINNVSALKGGFHAWQDGGNPVATGTS